MLDERRLIFWQIWVYTQSMLEVTNHDATLLIDEYTAQVKVSVGDAFRM